MLKQIRFVLLCMFLIEGSVVIAGSDELIKMRSEADKAYSQGNYQIAYNLFSALSLDVNADSFKAQHDLSYTVQSLTKLNRIAEVDEFLESVIQVRAQSWRMLYAAARQYISLPPYGFIVSGKFERGYHRGVGRQVNSQERDRIMALRLMAQALELMDNERQEAAYRLPESGEFFLFFADTLVQYRGQLVAWRLQYLSDLSVLPDYEEGYSSRLDTTHGAPVHPDGTPVFHQVPASFEEATTDGERWRLLLLMAEDAGTSYQSAAKKRLADFLLSQFGVQTMAPPIHRRRGTVGSAVSVDETGPFAVRTLGENETIARLASGIKRFKLPDEFNYIRIYREINEYRELARIFENRQQYPKAAEYWRKCRENSQIKQIEGNWGEFEPIIKQPAGKGASVEYRFRNGRRVEFEAYRLNVEALLRDIKAYIKSNPRDADWHKETPGSIGYRVVEQNETRYVGKREAFWRLDLNPEPDHYDQRITIETPLTKPGAYLLKAEMDRGNVSRIIIWIEDTVITKKNLDQGVLFYVADAFTGQPVAGANLEFFGYMREYLGHNQRNKTTIDNFAEFTDANGMICFSNRISKSDTESLCTVSDRSFNQNMRWLISATTRDGRRAHLGFSSVWYSRLYDEQYNQVKVFSITDRPVYRPAQTVNFKSWMRQARYDNQDRSLFAGRFLNVRIHNPRQEVVYNQNLKADEWGGVTGSLALPEDAVLGVYQLFIPGHGATTFRVEEYKKPEFEVKIHAPSEPVRLGDTIKAEIQADYYFGAPVTQGTVNYKVLRYTHQTSWFPVGAYDWLYGSGYSWLGYEYSWYPGWSVWGKVRPAPWWRPSPALPPEVVMESQASIGHDGKVIIHIDTLPAKVFYGDKDHRYEITAEVTDQSRRVVTGKGSVLAARTPFTVTAWVHRGYYRSGDTIQGFARALTADNQPVQGTGEFSLFKINYDQQRNPQETKIIWQSVNPDSRGSAHIKFTAAQAGQYRLVYSLTAGNGHQQEGAYIFTVRGEGDVSADFRFNHLEIIPEKNEYAPGETVRLLINTDQADSSVLLFIRPSNGVYLPPEYLKLEGKSTVYELGITQGDMPNFFVEALTIANGKIHEEVREIMVPPAQRVLELTAEPLKEIYKPGEQAKVKILLTESDGKPFIGSAVVTVYDKAVEYIAGGTNIPDIKAFFWKWRRQHQPATESNLDDTFHQLLKSNEERMRQLGVFGHITADEHSSQILSARGAFRDGRGREDRLYLKSSEPPMAPMAPMADMSMPRMMADSAVGETSGAGEPGPEAVEVEVRTEFADTAYWQADIVTDAQGYAEIEFAMPENLTTWAIKAWAMGHGTKVAESTTQAVTAKNLIIRLQAPRFFVETDEVVLSAIVHNYLNQPVLARVILELDGPCLIPLERLEQQITLEPAGEQRVDWRVRALVGGEAVIRMKALTAIESDAMEMCFPVYVHGMDKLVPYCGVIRPEQQRAKFKIKVPEKRRINASRLEIRYSPTLAGAMMDALPYLLEYPYGCTEQTLNRFVPAVITQNILMRLGLDLETIARKKTNLNAQEIGDDAERAAQWKRLTGNPVYDARELRKIVQTGVDRLTRMQVSDGGWGWFSGYGERSFPHTTAVVVRGLQIAEANQVALVPGVLQRGIQWLQSYQAAEVTKLKNGRKKDKPQTWKNSADNLDALIYMILADADIANTDMLGFLYEDRNNLSVYGKTLFGLALHQQQQIEKLDMLLTNIAQYLVRDPENQTAWLNLGNQHYWWYWYGSEIETHAFYLKLLSRVDPQSEDTAGLVKYLLNNRKHATYWNSTRDTALCIEALGDYLIMSGEDKPDMTLEIKINGKTQQQVTINADNLFDFDNRLVIIGDAVETGTHTIEIIRQGTGPVYFNSYLSYFTLEDYITRAGLEIKVDRQYYRLERLDKTIKTAGAHGQALDMKVEQYQRVPIRNLEMLDSGTLVEVELTIESKNDYEYLVFDDMKAAGFEPVEVRSGYVPGGLGAYMELRDERAAFFVRWLPRGKHNLSYRLRAEIPGRFSALPAVGYGMYAPELRGNSDEIKLQIQD